MKDLDFDNLDFSMMGTNTKREKVRKTFFVFESEKVYFENRARAIEFGKQKGLKYRIFPVSEKSLYGRQGYRKGHVMFPGFNEPKDLFWKKG